MHLIFQFEFISSMRSMRTSYDNGIVTRKYVYKQYVTSIFEMKVGIQGSNAIFVGVEITKEFCIRAYLLMMDWGRALLDGW